MDITAEVGSRIRYHRKERKLSQEELAERSGLHPSYIGQLERGIKKPTIDSLYKITKGMDMSISDFLKDLEIVDKDSENFAVKSYLLIEQEQASDQRHLFDIIKQIIALKSN
ncbi:MAG: helix-turn-helix transcriptional regulator [Butyrivibrio sp.]|nr:helix-turn-helix transcriptional regulator [Butyrivibrio sp.]